MMIEDQLDRGRWYRRHYDGLRLRKSGGDGTSKNRMVFVVEPSIERAFIKQRLDIFMDRFQDRDAGKTRPNPNIFQLLNYPPEPIQMNNDWGLDNFTPFVL